jgi:hypothetical protein
MHSFPAGSANSYYTLRIRPVLASVVDEVCGTLARLCAYLMTLALDAPFAVSRYGSICPLLPRWRRRQDLEPGRAHRSLRSR